MSNTEYLIATAIHLAIWIFLYRTKHHSLSLDVFDPFYLITGLYFLIFVFAPYTWIRSGINDYQGINVLRYLPQGTIAFNIGFFAYAFASIGRFTFGSINQIKNYDKDYEEEYVQFLYKDEVRGYITRYAWIIYSISMLLTLLFYRLRGRSLLFMLTFGQGAELQEGRDGLGIYFLMYFIRSAIPSLLLLIAFSRTNLWLIRICAYVTVSVCMASGSRNLAICVVFAIIVYLYMIKEKRPKPITVLFAVVFLYLFVSLMGLYRNAIKIGNSIDLSYANRETMFSAFMYNINIFYPFYDIVGMMQNGLISSHHCLGILNIVIQFIPRIIWPSKPATLGQTALQAMYGSDRGGAAFPNIGEFYYETGMLGMIAFMFIFGYIVRNAYVKSANSKNPIVIVMYAILFGGLMQLVCRGHFPSWAFEIVFMWGPLFLINSKMKKCFLEFREENKRFE